MTEIEAKQKIVNWANKQIGTREGPNNWNKYAANADLTKLYGWNVQNQPWCDVFVDAGFIENFGYEVGSAMTYQYAGCSGAACRYSADYYKKAKAWHTTPELGDQVFFLVGGGINHTGIVTYVGDGSVVTVEGNSSDMVARRSYAIGSPQIAGYGRPNWSLAGRDIIVPTMPDPVEKPVEEKPQEPSAKYGSYTYSVKLPLLREGDFGPLVENIQVLLNAHGFDCGKADGQFGNRTKIAAMSFQRKHGLYVDGEIGGLTYKELFLN